MWLRVGAQAVLVERMDRVKMDGEVKRSMDEGMDGWRGGWRMEEWKEGWMDRRIERRKVLALRGEGVYSSLQ